ncbi:hypothetical protein SAMN06295905_3222 [Devosia lucknowensis]|uniref:Uncharacterized protein n=1 Tax=Devosia lucknowensis TaxID=1096929 RepID=A0A1Y6GBS6_9HYPH|nr:hypothetical protein [Devosia lucknowensis]SMQ85927.1 hypothetical protein SAMN06295905_3222 [Devosia lucknowensis]
MLQVLAIITGSVLAAIGWVVRRRIRNEAVDEIIKRRLSLVELYQRMKAAELDIKGLNRLESELISLKGAENQAQMPQNRPDSGSARPVHHL